MEIRESSKRPHQRLEVWRDAMDLVEATHRFSENFPDAERFALVAMNFPPVLIPSLTGNPPLLAIPESPFPIPGPIPC